MKKRILAVLLSAAMVVTMTACGGSSSSSSSKGEGFKVGLVTDVGGVNDGSFNQSSWEGLQRAATDFGIEANYLESKTDSDYKSNIDTFIDEDYDLIISVGYMLAEATREKAEEHPDRRFAIIDDDSMSDLDNVTSLMFRQEQASYLVGYVAGLMTEANNVGFVVGQSTEIMNQFGYGYCAGAIDANPDVVIQQANANSFSDAAKGRSLTTNEITAGADVIFHAAGGTGIGVIQQCQDSKVWAIGVDTDQSGIAEDVVITSALKRVDNAVYDAVQSLIEGTLESGVHTYDLAAGGVDIAPTELLPDEVIAAVDEVKESIIKGDVVVPRTQEEFEAKYGDVYILD